MKIKVIAGLAFLLNTFLYGTYYSVAKEALGHIDPIVFTFFTMMTLAPPAIIMIAFSWRHITREIVKSGFLLGSCLCLGLFTLSVALKYNTATGTAFFPALNGLLAAIIAWLFLRQPLRKITWFAGFISVSGAVLLMINASMGGLRGSVIAFIGGLFCTLYIFLADHEQKDKKAYWSLFGVELLTMALWANLIALLFGDWQAVNLVMPNDLMAILYVGLGTTFLPTLFTVLLQNYLSPVTVSFISILEPIFGAVVAVLYLHEVLPFYGYVGGGLVVAGMILHTWSTVERPSGNLVLQQRFSLSGPRLQTSVFGRLVYPLICCGIGLFIVFKLGGFPPIVWHELYSLGPQLPAQIQQGHGLDVFLLVAQAVSWLVAWTALLVMGGLASYRAFARLFQAPATPIDLDVRTLRQMGITPYHAPLSRPDKQLVQQRRLNRRQRLARIDELPVETWSEQAIITTPPVYNYNTQPELSNLPQLPKLPEIPEVPEHITQLVQSIQALRSVEPAQSAQPMHSAQPTRYQYEEEEMGYVVTDSPAHTWWDLDEGVEMEPPQTRGRYLYGNNSSR